MKLEYFRKKNKNMMIQDYQLRRALGVLGILLPFICLIGGWLFACVSMKPSISQYYHTNMRDIFVGLLICQALFLLSYKGYERIDNIVSWFTGITGFGIAIFPCLNPCDCTTPVGIFQLNPTVSHGIHMTCAITFFILLGLNSLFLFTLSDKKPIKGNKKIRNGIYIVCGIIILASIAVLGLIRLIDRPLIARFNLLFYFETIMLIAFGISWLVKGKTLWKDPKTE